MTMKNKNGWEKFISVLNSKFVIIAFIFVIISLATVLAGNLVIKEGTMTLNDNLFLTGLRANVVTTSSAYTMNSSNFAVIETGVNTVTLPSASNKGQIVYIARTTQPGNVYISRAGSDTIAGATSITLSSSYNSRTLIADGTNMWFVIGSS
jgi:hypothetical protein